MIAEHTIIGDAEITQAQQAALCAHRQAEEAWAAVEMATLQAAALEAEATRLAAIARRVSLQRGFRRVELVP